MVEAIMAEAIMDKVQVRTVGAFIVGESVTETALAGGTVVEIRVQDGDKGQSSLESRMSGLSYCRWTQLMNSIVRLI